MKPALLIARGVRRPTQGVALVITLILLAVITFMAITFLVVSRSERGAVSTTTDQTTARIAADDALERAKSELLMPMLAFSNAYAFDMLVSTNFQNWIGFQSGLAHPTNVNFAYKRDGSALTLDEQQQNLANLLFSPRVPVFMDDSKGVTHNQYYLDINRNGRPEPSGYLIETNSANLPVLDENNLPIRARVVGDPDWIGGLEFPERPHSPTNRFLYRYAYVVAPVGKTLDLNYMHNAAKLRAGNLNADYFSRNQGVGTWELNMAAFLTDLNTNMWYVPAAFGGMGSGYVYDSLGSGPNRGAGFDDAVAVLRYRYANDPATLWTPARLFGNANALGIFPNDFYDMYGSGPLVTSTLKYPDPDTSAKVGIAGWGWPGSYNTNLFYSPNDLFDRKKVQPVIPGGVSLVDRLEEAGRRPSSYDRYTFHRLLSQLGTESAPETPRLNVNYRNVDHGKIIPNLETNFIPWTPLEFFTNAANRLLENAGFTFTITNIQVAPTNFYTPAVHRALQFAANIFEATTNKVAPTVYRPRFQSRTVNGTNMVFIVGYTEVDAPADIAFPYHDLVDRNDVNYGPNDMVYGIPLVIGARRGFPNFNEFAMNTKLTVTRKLEFRRQGGSMTGPIVQTNQMYTLALTNTFGIEFWNSYSNAYPRDVEIRVVLDVFPTVTNELGTLIYPSGQFPSQPMPIIPPVVTIAANSPNRWRGFTSVNMDGADGSMVTPLRTNWLVFMPQATYHHGTRTMTRITGRFEPTGSFYVPQWKLNLRTRLRATVTDTQLGRIIDFVNIAQSEETVDVTDVLMRDSPDQYGQVQYPYRPSGTDGSLWATNRYGAVASTLGAPTFGILNQIKVSQYANGLTASSWGLTNKAGIDFFRAQFNLSPQFYQGTSFSKTNIFYAPFSPSRDIYLFSTWQANDPLVHYTVGDLVDMGRSNKWGFDMTFSSVTNIGRINRRYEPWTLQSLSGSSSPTRKELGVKDPEVTRSDDWDFPSNKLANVGWLGRVHRGTAWQTVYLKSKVVDPTMWMKWGGSGIFVTNVGQIRTNMVPLGHVIDDTAMSRPTNDWAVPDVFTASLVDNATRGQLSINQTNLAAWSAVLSGVPVLSNLNEKAWTIIQPAAVDPALNTIVGGIARTREGRPGSTFKRLGEICSVPELTVKSPFIDEASGPVSDAVYERIPQQVLGLLRCDESPRFVVYSYGQSLKPARASVLTSGPYQGMCTNYQVTAEVATRAVVRVDGMPDKPRVVVENFNVLPPD